MRKITLRLYLKNGKIRKYYTSNAIRRILYKASHVNFEKAYCRVNYGKFEDPFGKIVNFYNDGYYTDKKELFKVIQIFWYES